MTFIEEIAPYIERIKLHQEGGRITSIEILREIAGIHFTHIRSKDFDTPSNLGCGNCVKQMINQLVGKIDRDIIKLERPVEDVPYIEVKDKQLNAPKKMTFPKQEPVKKTITLKDRWAIMEGYNRHEEMKWGMFKKYCTSKGIKVKGKKRVQLEEELNNL